MNLLALIPARGGSKRLPGKNVRSFYGKPLIAWTIEAARKSKEVGDVVVTTDDESIADVARAWGASVPFIRPEELATDETPGIEPVLHALSELSEYDWVLLLQPTSPLRSEDDIDGIVEFCRRQDAHSAVSIREVGFDSDWIFTQDDHSQLAPVFGVSGAGVDERKQMYVLNGALYLARVDWLRKERKFVTRETVGYVMPEERSADIDTPNDWVWAEYLMEKKYG